MNLLELQVIANVTTEPAPASKRTLANRRNALKSTGPRTPEGKAVSRRNAVKLGLSGEGTILPHAIECDARERCKAWVASFQPANQADRELVELAATTLTRLHHCWREEGIARARIVDRADRLWDLDREAEIEELAARLPDKPEQISAQLRRTAHGAAWLLEQWEALAARLEAGETWDDEARSLALDLLGVRPVFRDRMSPVDRPDADEQPEALRQQRLEVARAQIDALGSTIDDYLIPIDEDEREIRLNNLVVVPDANIARFMRYERALSGRVMSLVAGIRKATSAGARAAAPSRYETKPTPPEPMSVPRTPIARPAPPPDVTAESRGISRDEPRVAATAEPGPLKLSRTTAFGPTEAAPRISPVEVPTILPPELAALNLTELSRAALSINPRDTERMRAMTKYLDARVEEIRSGGGSAD